MTPEEQRALVIECGASVVSRQIRSYEMSKTLERALVNREHVIALLIAVARAAYFALEDCAETCDAHFNITGDSVRALSEALDALDKLPYDQPFVVMTGPAKAEWALRQRRGAVTTPEEQRELAIECGASVVDYQDIDVTSISMTQDKLSAYTAAVEAPKNARIAQLEEAAKTYLNHSMPQRIDAESIGAQSSLKDALSTSSDTWLAEHDKAIEAKRDARVTQLEDALNAIVEKAKKAKPISGTDSGGAIHWTFIKMMVDDAIRNLK